MQFVVRNTIPSQEKLIYHICNAFERTVNFVHGIVASKRKGNRRKMYLFEIKEC
jgi:hypothetical protein